MEEIRRAAFAGKPVPALVIDAHCHVLPYRMSGWYEAYDDTRDVVSRMDDLGIDCAVTAPHTLIGGDMRLTNEEARRAANDFPGRFYAYISVIPQAGLGETRYALERCAGDPLFLGLKFLPGYHGSLLQAEYGYALDFANEAGCPVLMHRWNDDPPIKELRAQLDRRPNLKLIVAHQGGGDARCSDAIAPLLDDYPNMRIEMCGSLGNRYGVEELVELFGADKLIYGSDLINLDPRYDFGRVAFSPIADVAKRKIFAENYLRLLDGSQMGRIHVK